MLTEQDTAVSAWLSAVSPTICQSAAFSPVRIFIQGKVVVVQCSHQCMAKELRSKQLREYDLLLKTAGYGLKILVGEKEYRFIPPSQAMSILYENLTLENSQWARMNASVIDLMSDDGTVSVHSADRDGGYRILTIQPYRKIDAALCLPKERLVGQSAIEGWDKTRPETEVIAVTKQRVIEEVISTQQKTTHTYQMPWNGLQWKMGVTGVLVNDGEVLLITRQLEDYQRKYWENYVG